MDYFDFVLLPPKWLRGPAQVNNGYVEMDRRNAIEYCLDDTNSSHEMAFAFSSLTLPDPMDTDALVANVKKFVRRYGMLWHGADSKNDGICREPLDEWRTHSLMLAFLGTLYRAINESIEHKSTDPVRATFKLLTLPGLPNVPEQEYVLEATRWLARQINWGMQGHNEGRYQWGLTPEGPGDLRLAQAPTDLQAHVYATFAALMATKAAVETCPGCGRLFSPRDSRQKWCTPGCGSTKRSQVRRARLREK